MRKLNSRTIHRYLSVIIGIQLLLWTLSGLIFSWNSIDRVRGEHLVRKSESVDLNSFNLIDLEKVLARDSADAGTGYVPTNVELRPLLDMPVYEIQSQGLYKADQFTLYNAESGERISPISESLARRIAQADFSQQADAVSAKLIEDNVGSHSEYRGKELPAWRIELDHSSGTVIYVSANRGIVTTRRNSQWRLFDFFWMLHTMDYQGRDNFNSWILKSFSIFGMATVLSGYWLWWRSSRIRRRWRNKKNRADGILK